MAVSCPLLGVGAAVDPDVADTSRELPTEGDGETPTEPANALAKAVAITSDVVNVHGRLSLCVLFGATSALIALSSRAHGVGSGTPPTPNNLF